jgi:hypothetical protein
MKYSKIKFLTFFAIICSIGLAPINDASANEGTAITEVATLEHDLGLGQDNSLVQVDADTYALAYTGVDGDGFISTFDIAADGTTITEVATLEHDTDNGTFNSLVQVDSDTYALAYAGTGQDGFISTFTISSSGVITAVRTQSLGNNLEHDTVHGRYNSLVQVDSDTYALAYTGDDPDANFSGNGFISTFTISSSGAITAVKTQSLGNNLEHDTVQGYFNSLVQVDSDTYALAYSGSDYDGFISTFDIAADGTITAVKTQSLGNNLEHDESTGAYNSLVQVDSDTYALAYYGDGNVGFISTFDIAADGTITAVKTQSLGNNLGHDTAQGKYNSLVQVDADTYALAYAADASDGYISTFDIAADGTTITEVATLEHDADFGMFNSLVQVDSDTYALAYSGSGDDGFISTFTIGTAAATDTPTTTSSGCYDCKPPVLQSSHITILTNDYVVATGDDPIHITANVGDKVTVILNVTDNKFVDTIPFAALYTNYQEKPSDMSAYYANNFDKWKHVSTSFYEWNIRADDVPYDYDGTVSWSDNTPTVVTGEITDENYFMINDNNVLEYFMMPFTFTMSNSMDESAISAKIYDAAGNRLHVTLPVTLQTAGNDPLNFDHMGKQKVLGFYDESVLSEMAETWSESESDAKQLSSLLGISEESLPAWSTNLATWVADDKIDSANMIVAVEYLINQ